jgi:hypothetical protein
LDAIFSFIGEARNEIRSRPPFAANQRAAHLGRAASDVPDDRRWDAVADVCGNLMLVAKLRAPSALGMKGAFKRGKKPTYDGEAPLWVEA